MISELVNLFLYEHSFLNPAGFQETYWWCGEARAVVDARVEEEGA